MLAPIKKLFSGGILVVVLYFWFDAAALALQDPRIAFAGTFPLANNRAEFLDDQAIRRYLGGVTYWDIDIQDRYVFRTDGALLVQPHEPLYRKWGSFTTGKWRAKQGALCMSLGSPWGVIGTDERCFRVTLFRKMLLLAPVQDPTRLVMMWNAGNNALFYLDPETHQRHFVEMRAIVQAEEEFREEAPAGAIDKWNPPRSSQARALHAALSGGARLRNGWSWYHHRADGRLAISRQDMQKPVVGRWWMSGDLYCARYGIPGMLRTFCLSPNVLENEGTFLFGRIILKLVP